MAAIFQMTFSKVIFLNENLSISTKISIKLVPKGPLNNIPALVQLIDWYPTGNKPLSEAMMAYFPDTFVHRSASMSQNHIPIRGPTL